MLKINTKNASFFELKAVSKNNAKKDSILKNRTVSEYPSDKCSEIFYKKKVTAEDVRALAITMANAQRNYSIDIKSFLNDNVTEKVFSQNFTEQYLFEKAEGVYNAKTEKKDAEKIVSLKGLSASAKKVYEKAKIYLDAVNYARDLQTTPPNILNSEVMANRIKKDLVLCKNLSVKILNKKQIKDLGMNLIISVNNASHYEARVVIVEYKGKPSSKEKTVLIGKGITFDAGGMNIKTGQHMRGMKYDMSGAATAISTLKAISKTKPKTNVAAIVALTDNMVSATASQPDSVWKAMNGKTVEINNTDAEGRLVMADILTYGAKKLKATRLVDIATLTGAVVVALGDSYTGVWSTTDKAWKDLEKAAQLAGEAVWRMPLHKDFFKYMSGSKVADMYNTDLSGKGGSNSAAMFLNQFNEGIEHIHLDIAGTAEKKGICQGPMVKTLIELVSNG